ncbi:alanine:cation symporter family protein [Streptomyces sp. NPDC001970]
MGFMALANILAILPLSGIAFRLLNDYQAQRRAGLDPVFTRDRLPDLKGVECWDADATGPDGRALPAVQTDAAPGPGTGSAGGRRAVQPEQIGAR